MSTTWYFNYTKPQLPLRKLALVLLQTSYKTCSPHLAVKRQPGITW